jgi:hypothetical protein
MAKKLFIALCIAAPLAFAIARETFRPPSITVSGVFMVSGLVLSLFVFGWSVWNLFYHRRRALLGLASLLVCFGYFAVLSDYFASHAYRQRQSLGTNAGDHSR